jgi:hypothetical protein
VNRGSYLYSTSVNKMKTFLRSLNFINFLGAFYVLFFGSLFLWLAFRHRLSVGGGLAIAFCLFISAIMCIME